MMLYSVLSRQLGARLPELGPLCSRLLAHRIRSNGKRGITLSRQSLCRCAHVLLGLGCHSSGTSAHE